MCNRFFTLLYFSQSIYGLNVELVIACVGLHMKLTRTVITQASRAKGSTATSRLHMGNMNLATAAGS